MSTNGTVFKIIDGPNRNDLMNAFIYAYDSDIGVKICTFTVDKGQEKRHVNMRIVELAHEDGSGYSFILKGYYGINKPIIRAVGYYHARTREGWLRPEEND